MEISVIIPCYKSSSVLKTVLAELKLVLNTVSHEIILVDDGNNYNEKLALYNLEKQFENVKALQLDRNYGQHQATYQGCVIAKGKFIVTMDDDGQHNSDFILKMQNYLITSGNDLVYARFIEIQEAIWRKIVRKLLRNSNESKSSFRIWTQAINERLINSGISDELLDKKLAKLTPSIGYFDVVHRKSLLKKSRYKLKDYFKYLKQTF
ncbi:glycosyltransferase family 2 protein [Flavobacterium fluviatile]|uniref:glycosyltransferase family 2 protein n=1 Tax=Flavobacterium fluviatile TaxID=1862387 RepID=UPI0013D85F3A|nr:glycosyltransferase family 2 protein [Flavobacterium fluviatile]